MKKKEDTLYCKSNDKIVAIGLLIIVGGLSALVGLVCLILK
jgi:hypothetical protein